MLQSDRARVDSYCVPNYGSGTTTPTRKITVSLDAELVEELEAVDVALSKKVTEAVGETLVRRRRERMLSELLDGSDRRL